MRLTGGYEIIRQRMLVCSHGEKESKKENKKESKKERKKERERRSVFLGRRCSCCRSSSFVIARSLYSSGTPVSSHVFGFPSFSLLSLYPSSSSSSSSFIHSSSSFVIIILKVGLWIPDIRYWGTYYPCGWQHLESRTYRDIGSNFDQ